MQTNDDFRVFAVVFIVYVLDQALKMLHPFMPFVTEALWAETGTRDTQLIVAEWPQLDGLQDAEATAEMDWLINLVTDIRRLRAEMNIPAGAKLSLVAVGAAARYCVPVHPV